MLHIIRQIKGEFINLVEAKFDTVGFVKGADTNNDRKLSWDEIVNLMNKLSEENSQLANEKYEIMDKMANDAFNWKNISTLKMINALKERQKWEIQEVTDDYVKQKSYVVEGTRGDTTIEKTSSRFLSVAKDIDLNHTWRIWKTEVKKYISTISDQNMKAAISNAWNENWITYWSEWIPVRDFVKMIENKYESYNSVKNYNESREYSSLSTFDADVARINSMTNDVEKFKAQLAFWEKIIQQYENITWSNDLISKHIWVIWVFRELAESNPTQLERYIIQAVWPRIWNEIVKKCSKNPAMLSVFMTAITSLSLSLVLGWGSLPRVTINIFWLRLDSHMVRLWKLTSILKRAWINNPVTWAGLLRKLKHWKLSKKDANEISNLLASHHLGYWAEKLSIDKAVFREMPFVLKAVAKLLWKWHKLYSLLEDYKNASTVDERARITWKISTHLEEYLKDIDERIKELKDFNVHWDVWLVLDFIDYSKEKKENSTFARTKFNEAIAEAQKLKSVLKKVFQKNAFAEENRQKTLNLATLTKEQELKEIYSKALEIEKTNDKINDNKDIIWVLRGIGNRFWLALPKNWNWTNWLEKMKTYSLPSKPWVSAISNLIASLQEFGELWDNVSIKDFERWIKKGRFLTESEREEFKKILVKNSWTDGRGTDKIWNHKIYVFEVNWHKVFLKDNCANAQDTFPSVQAYQEVADYYTVSVTYKLWHKNTVERSETEEKHHSAETKKIHHPAETKKIHHPAKTHEVDVPNSNPGWDTKWTDIDPNADWGDASWNPAGGNPGSTPGGGNIWYHKETVIDKPAYNEIRTVKPAYDEVITVKPAWTEYITKTWKEVVKVPWKIDALQSVIWSILVSSLDNNTCQKEIETTLIKKWISTNKAKKYAKELVDYRTAKWVSRPKSDPIAVPYGIEKNEKNYYIVKKGDTLSKIAKENNTTVQELKKININNIEDVNKIRPGQKIYLHKKK